MTLSDRIREAQEKANYVNNGCRSCHWWSTISDETRALINDWIDAENSRLQLYIILSANVEGQDEPPLDVSDSAWRTHLRHHNERCRNA